MCSMEMQTLPCAEDPQCNQRSPAEKRGRAAVRIAEGHPRAEAVLEAVRVGLLVVWALQLRHALRQLRRALHVASWSAHFRHRPSERRCLDA